MKIKCSIITPTIKGLASKLNISPAYANNLVSAWQTEHPNARSFPAYWQLQGYMKEKAEELATIELAVPYYSSIPYQEGGKLSSHTPSGEVTIMHLPNVEVLYKAFEKDPNINYIKSQIKSLYDAHLFLLYREMAKRQNDLKDTNTDNEQASREALTKVMKFHQAFPNGMPKPRANTPTAFTSTSTEGNNDNTPKRKTITYTPKGKTRQTYYIEGSHIYNKQGKEVFSKDSKDRTAIFVNLAVSEGRAVKVSHKGHDYIVNTKGQIVSVSTREFMKWGAENGDRIAILEGASKIFEERRNAALEKARQNQGQKEGTKTFGADVLAQPHAHFYTEDITPSPNTIFVFGSNPEGRHGAGNARVAKDKFGAVQGVGEGLTGNAYALPTKDLRVTENGGRKSISPEQITENIKKMYEVARQNPDKVFKVAFRNTDTATLNGYTGYEMIDMFNKAGEAPENVQFSQEWFATGLLGADSIDELIPQAPNTEGQIVVPNYENDNNDLPSAGVDKLKVDRENPIARLALEINPIQRRNRVNMIAKEFTFKLNQLVQDKFVELDERAAEASRALARADGDPKAVRDVIDTIKQIERERKLYSKAYEGRKAILQQEGSTAKDIFESIKRDFEEAAKDEQAVTPERRDAYQKTVNNFQLLVNEACAILENTEHVRIVFKENDYHNGTETVKKTNSDIDETSDEAADAEAQFGDDEDGKRVEGNIGWSYQVRFTDPRTSISMATKAIISNIKMVDNDGLDMEDDLGRPIYMDEGYVHTVLLNELSDMISPDDFSTDDGEGNVSFPALEKAAEKYPWIQQIIDYLDENLGEYEDENGNVVSHPEYVSAFYADFRKDFIPYWMQYFGQRKVMVNGKQEVRWMWVNKQMNQPMARESTLDEVRSNYEHGYKLDSEAVYEVGNRFNINAAKTGIDLMNDAISTLSELLGMTDEDSDELRDTIDKATRAFRILGINTTSLIVHSLLDTENGETSLMTALKDAKAIFERIEGETIREGSDLIEANRKEYNELASLIGSVSELANVGSFRNGDKTYYSYSAPNYMDTQFKKFKSDSRRQSYLDDEFKRYKWFYNADNRIDDDDIRNKTQIRFTETELKYITYDKDSHNWRLNDASSELSNDYLETLANHIQEVNNTIPSMIESYKFNNTWLWEIQDSDEIRSQMEMKELKTIKDPQNDPNGNNSDYRNWQPLQIKRAFIQEYFSVPFNSGSKLQFAFYNFPIFSDSPVAKFIKFRRYVANQEDGSIEQQLLPLFRKVVKQELQRMRLVEDRQKAREEAQKNGEKGPLEIDYFDTNGRVFQFFPDFNYYVIDNNGNIIETFGDTDEQAAAKGTFLKDKIIELGSDFKAIDELIDKAVKYNIDSLYNNFLQDFSAIKVGKDNMLDTNQLSAFGQSVLEDMKAAGIIKDSMYLNSDLKEYFWNQAFATTQIIQITTTDLAFYKNANDFQKRYKEVYAAGTKLNTNSNYSKKFYKTMYITDNIITSPSYMDIKKSLDDAVREKHISEADREEILDSLEGINVADAQAFRSLNGIRSVLDMMGQWTPEMDIVYDHITNGQWTMDDLRTIWQTLKPFVYTQLDSSDGLGGRMKIPHQNKNSEFALLQAYVAVCTGSKFDSEKGDYVAKTVSSPILRAMGRFMMDNDIDVIQFQSAVKTGNQGDVNLNLSHGKLVRWAKGFKKSAESMRKAAQEKDLKPKEMEVFRTSKNPDINLLEKLFRNWHNRRLTDGTISQETFNKTMDDMLLGENEAYQILQNTAFPNGQENEEVVHTIPYDDYIIQQPTPEHLLDTKAVFGSQFRNLIISDLPEDFQITVNGKTLGKKAILQLYNSLIVENLLSDFEALQEKFKDIETFQQELIRQVNGNPKYGRDMLDALQLVEVDDGNGHTHKEFNIPLYNPSTTLKIQELVNSMFKNQITKQYIKGGACILVSSFGFTDKLHVLHNEDGSIRGMECYMPAYSKQFFEPFMKEDENGKLYLDPEELPSELRRVIGYRIPTEDKYSMAPLYIKGFLPQQNGSCIMLPAETTLFSGEDYDVDKKFLMLPEFEIQRYDMGKAYRDYQKVNGIIEGTGQLFKGTDFDAITSADAKFRDWFFGDKKGGLDEEGRKAYLLEHPIVKKVKYDMSKQPQEQSRAARNNMIFDISYAILTSKDAAEKIHNPGSFTKAKRAARLTKVAENPQLRELWRTEHNLTTDVELAHSLLNASYKELDDFTKRHNRERSQLTLDTFIYNHKQNMTGDALIGMYANNTSMQAKYQQTSLGIKKEYSFRINGREIISLHDIMSPLNERISKNCANFSAASVDNVKDPVLADLRQNPNTANIMGMLLRAGLSIQEASLLFMQPIVAEWIDETGGDDHRNAFKKNYIDKYIQILQDNGGSFDDKVILNKHNFTSEELMLNVLRGIDITDNENLAKQIEVALLFKNIMLIAKDLADLTKISRADSPNGAIKPSIAGAYGQWESVQNYQTNAAPSNKFFTLTGISDSVKNNQLIKKRADGSWQYLYGDKDAMREAILSSKMPLLQAFYSLGIESARKFLSPYFSQLTPAMMQATTRIERNSSLPVLQDKSVNTWFKDAAYFALTKSTLFGDDGQHTYDEKRHYYLYEFPKKLMDVISQNPDIAQLTAIKKLRVYQGVISMANSGRLKQAARESLQRDFDMLLYMDNPQANKLAIDLFMYSFYKEGYNFGPNTIGGMFSTLFLDSIPEYVQALRQIPQMMKEEWFFKRFIPQFYANRWDLPYLFPQIGLGSTYQKTADGKYIMPFAKVKNRKTSMPYQYLTFTQFPFGAIGNFVLESTNGQTAVYVPMAEINGKEGYVGTKYNANMDAKEIAETMAEEVRLGNEAAEYGSKAEDNSPSNDSPYVEGASGGFGSAIDGYENGETANPEANVDETIQRTVPQGQNTVPQAPQGFNVDDIEAMMNQDEGDPYNPDDSNAQLKDPLC